MSDETWRPRHNPWAIAMTVTLATFMEVLDTSIANVSLPHIAGNLSVGVDETHLGADVLPGVERDRPAAVRLAVDGDRPQALLHDLRGAVHRQLVPVRAGAQPRHADRLPRPAGRRRRRPAAERAGDPRRHLPAASSAAWRSPSTAWRWCSRPPSARRSAARSPTTPAGAGSSSSTCRSASCRCSSRIALVEDPPWVRAGGAHGPRRLHRARSHRRRPRRAAGRARQGRSATTGSPRALIVAMLALSVLGIVALVVWELRRRASDPRAAPLQEPQLRRRLPDDADARRGAVRHDGAPPAVPADGDGLQRRGRGQGAVAGRPRRHRAVAAGRAPPGARRRALAHRVRLRHERRSRSTT